MHVVRHDAVGMYDQALLSLAEANAVQEDITVECTSEYVNPLYDREGDEVGSFRIANFVLAAQRWLAIGDRLG